MGPDIAPALPVDAVGGAAILGLTPDEIWTMDEASGNLVGKIAATALAVAGAPTFQRRTLGDLGVYYDAAGDNHNAAVFAFGVGSAWIGAIVEIVSTGAGQPGAIGRSDAAAAESAALYLQNTGEPSALIRDNGANSLTLVGPTDLRTVDTQWFCQLQIDRATTTARMLWSPLNNNAPPFFVEGSISGFASLDSGDEVFHLGDFGTFGEGLNVQWASVARGVQCEGAHLLRTIARKVGKSVPWFTWPESPVQMRAACGERGTWASGWQCDEALGNLADLWGGITLSPTAGAPAYNVSGPLSGDDRAVRFAGAAADTFTAAAAGTYDLDASTSIAIYLCVRFTSLVNRNIMGKAGPVANEWAVQLQSSPVGEIIAFVDSGATVISATVAADHWQAGAGNWHDVLMVIDRANQRLRCFTELGASPDVDISAAGTLTNATPFHVGAANSSTICGCDIAFAAVATGDIPALRTNGADVIARIRRLTGR